MKDNKYVILDFDIDECGNLLIDCDDMIFIITETRKLMPDKIVVPIFGCTLYNIDEKDYYELLKAKGIEVVNDKDE